MKENIFRMTVLRKIKSRVAIIYNLKYLLFKNINKEPCREKYDPHLDKTATSQ